MITSNCARCIIRVTEDIKKSLLLSCYSQYFGYDEQNNHEISDITNLQSHAIIERAK